MPSAGTSVQGAHYHTFANPHGLVYRIGCFTEAPGCRTFGPASDQFPWFAGYTWQVEGCLGCGLHLGWLFHSSTSAFHGLIVDRLVHDYTHDPSESA